MIEWPESDPGSNPFYPMAALFFSMQHGRHFQVVRGCPRGGNTVLDQGHVHSVVELGYALSHEEVPFHECDNPKMKYQPVVRMEDTLRTEIEAIEAIMVSPEIKGQMTKAWNWLNIINAKSLLLIAERLRRDE